MDVGVADSLPGGLATVQPDVYPLDPRQRGQLTGDLPDEVKQPGPLGPLELLGPGDMPLGHNQGVAVADRKGIREGGGELGRRVDVVLVVNPITKRAVAHSPSMGAAGLGVAIDRLDRIGPAGVT